MNRGHSADDYRRMVDRLRAARPDIALSSDFIVGFPGESERISRRRSRSCATWDSRSAFHSNTAGARHAGGAHAGASRGSRSKPRARSIIARPPRRAAARVQRRHGRPRVAGAVREAGPACRPIAGRSPLSAAGPRDGAGASRLATSRTGRDHWHRPNSLAGEVFSRSLSEGAA